MRTIDIPEKTRTISLNHGSGGKMMHSLIDELFVRYFDNTTLEELGDAALLKIDNTYGLLAFSTDSFVIDPLFFPGGDIGKLAVCGTVNDLAVSGAKPVALSCGFIIEEGFDYGTLEKIIESMAHTAELAGVKIVTGDTKVVPKGKCDKLFINTSGLGVTNLSEGLPERPKIEVGDKIIINGGIAEHGMAVMKVRENLPIYSSIQSDCAALNGLIESLNVYRNSILFMRDATRGGVATVLCEIAHQCNAGIEILEAAVPIKEEVRGICELLGFDPLYVANEGKAVMIVKEREAGKILDLMKKHPLGKEAAIIGTITSEHSGRVVMETEIGGKRIVDMLSGEQLPRIC